ncbi:MAG TPA: hypothetical protein VFM39_05535, partial [bacterium]|nr:hypothetical protein [bacterium]
WTIVVATSVGRILFDALRSDVRAVGVLTLGQIPALILIVWGSVALLRGPNRGTANGPEPVTSRDPSS